jgi:uncharacterized protein YbbC (DUF1343 family)
MSADLHRRATLDRLCYGVQITLIDRQVFILLLGVEITSALLPALSQGLSASQNMGLIGSREVFWSIKDGHDPHSIVEKWQGSLEEFCKLRARHLLY